MAPGAFSVLITLFISDSPPFLSSKFYHDNKIMSTFLLKEDKLFLYYLVSIA